MRLSLIVLAILVSLVSVSGQLPVPSPTGGFGFSVSAGASGGIDLTALQSALQSAINNALSSLSGAFNPFPNGFPTFAINPFAGAGGFGIPPPSGGFPGVPDFARAGGAGFDFNYNFPGAFPDVPTLLQNFIPRGIPALGANPQLAAFLANLAGVQIGTPQPLTANAPSTVTFFLGPNVTLTSSVDGQVTITPTTPRPPRRGVSASLPDGFAALRANGTSLFGYTIAFQPTTPGATGTLTGTFTTGPLDGFAALFANGSIGVLSYDVATATYIRIAAAQVTILTTGQVQFPINGAGDYFLLNLDLHPVPRNLGEGGLIIAANSGQSVSIIGRNGQANAEVLTISNIQAQAGEIFVNISLQASERQQRIRQAGRLAASQIFNFTHSLGGNAVTSATISFDISTSLDPTVNSLTLRWYKYNEVTSAWELQGGTLNGTLLYYTTTNGFSEWSVQGSANSNSNASAQLTPNILLLASIFLATVVARFF